VPKVDEGHVKKMEDWNTGKMECWSKSEKHLFYIVLSIRQIDRVKPPAPLFPSSKIPTFHNRITASAIYAGEQQRLSIKGYEFLCQ